MEEKFIHESAADGKPRADWKREAVEGIWRAESLLVLSSTYVKGINLCERVSVWPNGAITTKNVLSDSGCVNEEFICEPLRKSFLVSVQKRGLLRSAMLTGTWATGGQSMDQSASADEENTEKSKWA